MLTQARVPTSVSQFIYLHIQKRKDSEKNTTMRNQSLGCGFMAKQLNEVNEQYCLIKTFILHIVRERKFYESEKKGGTTDKLNAKV